MTLQVPKVVPNDWNRLRIIIDKLKHLRLGIDSNPTFTGITVNDLITDTITIKNTAGDIVFYVDADELYFTVPIAIAIEAGMPIGLALVLTYAEP